MTDKHGPGDPFSMAESAVAMHEIYISFIDAGFTEDQAMEIVKTMIVEGVRGSGD